MEDKMKAKGVLYWITGVPGAGKTTIGTALYYKMREYDDSVVLLDGDNLVNVFNSDKADFSSEGRLVRSLQYAKLCKLLTDQNISVVCCTVSMNDEVRRWNRDNNDCYVEVYLDVSDEVIKKRDYRNLYSDFGSGKIRDVVGCDIIPNVPQNPDIRIANNGELSVDECVDKILDYKPIRKYEETDDRTYWNNYYSGVDSAPKEPSAFAVKMLSDYISPDRYLLELGCGNGRDSIYFAENGVSVVAVDSSAKTIENLNSWKRDNKKDITFVCDDFTKTNAVYQQSFDYCYSRFTLHSITEDQEISVIKNVSNALSREGKFFIEVRSINDDIYGLGENVGKDAYIYEGHYRRFIRRTELEDRLRKYGNFEVIYSEEKRSFAEYKGNNPPIIRIVAVKSE